MTLMLKADLHLLMLWFMLAIKVSTRWLIWQLTGACVVALGPSIAVEIFAASNITGEKFWRMPLEESHWESLKSGVADMVNTGGRRGGSINAALSLKQSVDEKFQWLHIDVAGPVWSEKKRSATGFGVSQLVEWVSQLVEWVLKNSS